ncbi:CHASE2 domain-containing protein [Leptolyngbya cf. ectocarpi LEGE 11479]|uniref:CHASE2 domain-containing protein n=1 Tax=Leptolyngbya cf. ectocarpi LEGE 11479 TaxID=1828722 RepID=A0A928ZVM3_LEPEC|nr:CHASE2 domain-containing protein [Leptolyngbya ectocarpi]MBE9068307.1 CHASE2 domain-containing protein [Leptolyngbya cf. ectocarpi LEGE 11479]
MKKRVTLKLNDGSLETGFLVTLQIGDEGAIPTSEILGRLPAAAELRSLYLRWQAAYRQLGGLHTLRLGASPDAFPTNVSYTEDCQHLADELQQVFNQWLQSESFRPVQDKLLERLNSDDPIRLIVQAQQDVVQRLPWHLWNICDRYPKLEIALSAPIYEKKSPAIVSRRARVRILAVLGDSQGLDIETDLALLNHLPNAEIYCLTEPDRQTLDTYLWDTQGWDILFFAGHSSTQVNLDQINQNILTGHLHINPTEVITIPQLKHALQSALTRGLQIAIFNSCDGLGLAKALADLQIPQILVMQEVVPDSVAHAFLKAFLEAFARGDYFYLAVREAREKLQGLENKYPCASWLPTIYQNPANTPPVWNDFLHQSSPPLPTPPILMLLTHAVLTIAVIGLRYMGLFQGLELKAFDRFIRMRSKELPDSRLVVVTITEEDIVDQKDENPRGSLSDQALLDSLKQLEKMKPRVIGLDIYRDFSVLPNQPELAERLITNEKFIAVCKGRDSESDSPGIAPPPEVPEDRVGFSDLISDADGVLRRQLLAMTPEPSSPCLASYSLGAKLALNYLSEEDVIIQASPEGYLQMGDVIFKPIETNIGGYRGIEAWGHQLLLNYRRLDSPEQIANDITLTALRTGQVSPDAIRDRIVLIGTTADSSGDHWITPYSPSPRVEHQTSGVFIQAQMTSHLISAVLDNRPLLKTWPEWGETLWILAWGGSSSLIIALSGLKRQRNHSLSHWLLILLGTELGLWGICGVLLVKAHYWVPWVPPAILLLIIAGSVPISEYLILSRPKSKAKEVS